MSFKKMESNLSFADIALFNSIERNRAIVRMQQINAVVDWMRIDRILIRNYPIGKSSEGNEAYPPLLLLKCLLLQQWFRIDSDPELAFNLFRYNTPRKLDRAIRCMYGCQDK